MCSQRASSLWRLPPSLRYNSLITGHKPKTKRAGWAFRLTFSHITWSLQDNPLSDSTAKRGSDMNFSDTNIRLHTKWTSRMNWFNFETSS